MKFKRRGKAVYGAPTVQKVLILKKLNDNIRRVFRVRQTDRNRLIKTIATLLHENSTYSIFKTDIVSFYENIPKDRILRIVLDNNLLTPDSKWVLRKIFESKPLKNEPGLPRGLGISASLSELYLKYFDEQIRSHPNVYFYGRFVDDIIIFYVHDPREIKAAVTSFLSALHLNISEAKTFSVTNKTSVAHNPIQFDYLGYRFTKNGQNEAPQVTIAPKKIKKIKTRLAKSFLDYSDNQSFLLLENRIRFLTSNYHLHQYSAPTPIKAGIFFNYPLATHCECELHELDNFLRSQIFSARSITAKRGAPLKWWQQRLLKTYSFFQGYTQRIEQDFSDAEIRSIRKCWDND